MKWKRIGIVCVPFLLIGLFFTAWKVAQKETVLNVGFWSGSYWGVPTSDSYAVLDAAIEQFESEHPNVTVQYDSGILQRDYSEWLIDRMLMDDAPDLFLILPEDFEMLTSLSALYDLSGVLERDERFDEDAFYPATLSAGESGGKRYALPYECVPTLMFVNKTLLRNENIDIPEDNWTWDDFYQICEQVTKDQNGDGVLDQFGYYDYTWQDAMIANGTSIFTADGSASNLANQEAIEAVSFVTELNGLSEDYSVKEKDFDLGRVAFRPMLFSQYRAYQPYPWRIKKYSSFEWDCIPMPAGPSGNNVSEITTVQMGISNQSKHKKLAWELLELLTCEESIQSMLYSDSYGCSALTAVTDSEHTAQVLREDTPGDGKLDLRLLSDTLENAVSVTQFRSHTQALAMADTLMRSAMEDPDNLQMNLSSAQIELNKFLSQ